MPLPKIELPVYDFTIPSNGKTIRVRPFTVKEEKLLLMAIESKTASDIIASVKQVINNCIVKGTVSIDKLPFFDIDYLFIFLRAKSVGETVEVNITCNNTLEDGMRCGKVFPHKMDIAKCEIVNPADQPSKDIKLDKSKGVIMKYPSLEILKKINKGFEDPDNVIDIIIDCIDVIYTDTEMYYAKEQTREELREFVENLTSQISIYPAKIPECSPLAISRVSKS